METNNLLGIFKSILNNNDNFDFSVLKDIFEENEIEFVEPVTIYYFFDEIDYIEDEFWNQCSKESIKSVKFRTLLEADAVVSFLEPLHTIIYWDYDKDNLIFGMYMDFIDYFQQDAEIDGMNQEDYNLLLSSCNSWFESMISNIKEFEMEDGIYDYCIKS